jgi:DNA polymerase V
MKFTPLVTARLWANSPRRRFPRFQLPVATADTGKLIGAAVTALGALYRPGYRYKKAGVMLLDLVPAAEVQAGLFDAPDNSKSVARMKAVDGLNARFGRGAVAFGAAARKRQPWGLRREFISPRFTTVWDELLRV